MFLDGDKPASRDLVLERMRTHIRTVVSRYRGKVSSWDVVNEVLDDGEPYLRTSKWVTIAGTEFVARAFEWAHEADPDAVLVYNDYNVELPRKREKLLRLIQRAQGSGRPAGCDRHPGSLGDRSGPVPRHRSPARLDEGAGAEGDGLRAGPGVVPRGIWWADGGKNREEIAKTNPFAEGCPPELLERQASQYAELFRLFRDHSGSIGRITFWDLHDGRSWLNAFPWRHAEYPLLFDREARPKPAFRAVMEVR